MSNSHIAGWTAAIAAAIVVLLIWGSGTTLAVAAQDEFGCSGESAAYAGVRFDDIQHRLWYRRFWTGNCEGLTVLT